MFMIRTLVLLLFPVLLAGSQSALASYQPVPSVSDASTAVIATEALHGSSVKIAGARGERRLQKFLRRIHRALLHEGEGKYDTTSLMAMIFGVVGLVSLAFFPYLVILCVPALILGIAGLRHVKQDGTKGFGFATAGIVTGALGILLVLFGLIAALVILTWFLK
jgi:hypothetical protein